MMGFFSKEDKKQNQNEDKGKAYLDQLVQMISLGQGFSENDEKLV